jgi:hypothetical protein
VRSVADFDAEVQFLHQADDIQHRESADAVGNKVRGVLGEHDSLTEPNIGKPLNRLHGSVVSFCRRDDFKQPHIARWIKEMSAEPAAAKVFRETFDDACNRKPAGIGGNDCPWPANAFNFS